MKFKTHGITRPTWLGEGWIDHSCGNDAMPHATLFLTPDEGCEAPCIEVWVNYASKVSREVSRRYEANFRRTWNLESGADETLYLGEDEAAAKQIARGAEIAKTIIADILAGPVVTTSHGAKANLLDATSFSELHDYCDANMLGDQEKLLGEFGHTGEDDATDEAALSKAVDVLNHAQDIVDYWLKSRHAGIQA